LRAVLRLEKEVNLDVGDPGLAEDVVDHEVVRVCGPGEVVNALLAEPIENALSREVPLLDADAGRADLPR